MRPATRVGRCLIFEGGHTRCMGRWEYLLVRTGLKKTVRR